VDHTGPINRCNIVWVQTLYSTMQTTLLINLLSTVHVGEPYRDLACFRPSTLHSNSCSACPHVQVPVEPRLCYTSPISDWRTPHHQPRHVKKYQKRSGEQTRGPESRPNFHDRMRTGGDDRASAFLREFVLLHAHFARSSTRSTSNVA
jgi:hypothetical protein